MIALAVLPVVLAACGAHKPQTPQAQQAELKVEKQVDACLPTKNGAPDPLLLRAHAVRVKFVGCVVPPQRQATLEKCLLFGAPTKARLVACVEKNS